MKAITIVAAIILTLGVALGWKSSASKDLQPATDAAYRDGHYLGKLAAERGEQPHISVARWSTQKDRASFSSGYQEAYTEVVDHANAESQQDVFNGAAYRDGLYIGGMDAQQSRSQHIAAACPMRMNRSTIGAKRGSTFVVAYGGVTNRATLLP